MGQKQLIIITSGKEDNGGKATFAFAYAATCQALGMDTTVHLTEQGTIWADELACDRVHITGFEPLAEYKQKFLKEGGKLVLGSSDDENLRFGMEDMPFGLAALASNSDCSSIATF